MIQALTFFKRFQQRRSVFCGTAEYDPPEVVLKTGHGPSVDFCALGILVYELVEVFSF